MFARGEGRNRRRRNTDEENEEDEKEEESALSVGTAFGKIWECYCALSCLFFFSLLRSLSLSLRVFVVFGKMLRVDEKLSLTDPLFYTRSAEIPTDEILPIR